MYFCLKKGGFKIKDLKKDIKDKIFKNTYVFYGDEAYLKKYYLNELLNSILTKESMLMNLDTFDGKKCSVEAIYDTLTTLPFMSEYRVIVINDSMLINAGRKDDTEKLSNYLEQIPENTIIIFIESQIDKRIKLYKKLAKLGRVIEFNTPNESELVKWVNNILVKSDKTISYENAVYLLHTVTHNMDSILLELNKLIDYKDISKEIKKEDIELICIKSLEIKIFDLVDAVINKNINHALSIYNNLLLMKEQPIMILSMIARQFRLVLQCKKLKETVSSVNEISNILGLHSFVVTNCLKQSNNFTVVALVNALRECLEVDIDIKTGKKTDKLAVEMLIIKYCI